MSERRASRSLPSRKIDRLVRLLEEQKHLLAIAGCEKRLLSEYGALIKFLNSASPQELRRIFSGPALVRKPEVVEPNAERPQIDLVQISTGELQNLIEDEMTPRKDLERIAVDRFKVPRGSMRSFSNREMLVQKLQTMLRNEQAHAAIEAVARRHL